MISYANKERVKYCSLSSDLMTKYCNGSHTYENRKGDLSWEKDGKWHRDGDLPAWIGADGRLEWWQNNQLHRICGPAVIYPSGALEWWINYENITEEVNAWLAGEEWRGSPEQSVEFQLRFA